MINDLVSVIILSYKNGEYLFDAIDSVLKQRYDKIELIVADDTTPNFDVDKIEKYILDNKKDNIKQYRILVNEKNQGTVRNINTAVRVASGSYIKIIAGDDAYPNDTVFSKQIEYLENNPEKFFVIGKPVECDASLAPINNSKSDYSSKELLKCIDNKKKKTIIKYHPELIATQSICFRREFFNTYGLYDERFKLIEDLPMLVRILQEDVDFGYIDMNSVLHRGAVGVSTSKNAFDINKLQYYLDLNLYFSEILMPIRKRIGVLYVLTRYNVSIFRIKYTENKTNKIALILKYSPFLLLYTLRNCYRAKEYVTNYVRLSSK